MSNQTPIFPISEPRHYNDYGFDPQDDYFQVLEEAKRHKKKETSSNSNGNIDPHHFKLQNRDPESESITKQKKKRWWKKNPLLFFSGKRRSVPEDKDTGVGDGIHLVPAAVGHLSKSGPVYYITDESRSGSSTPYRNFSPIAGSMSPAQIPYVSLREFNVDQQHCSRMSTSAMPIYLVT